MERTFFYKIIVSIFAFYVLAIVVLGLQMRSWWMQYQMTVLESEATKIDNATVYKNGIWNTSLITSYSLIPHIYVVTSDGLVLERRQPIAGLLSKSDFKKLLTFREPYTIDSIENEKWRTLTQTIITEQEATLAAIRVSQIINYDEDLSLIDEILKVNLQTFLSKIIVRNNIIDVSKVATASGDVTYEIVNKSNDSLLKNGTAPTFIDKKSVIEQMQQLPRFQVLADAQSQEQFLVYTKNITREQKDRGVIVLGVNIHPFNELLKAFGMASSLLGLIGLPILAVLIYYLIPKVSETHTRQERSKKYIPKRLSFSRKESVIYVDNSRIAIPIDTNQFELTDALFSSPSKKWELDELMKKFGESSDNKNPWRTVYDAALALNKKVGFRIVEYKDRRFSFSSDFVHLIEQSRP